ncbi:MAG TPA: periplasmic heavy metal sensor [Terriglobales bacterium]|nr:periplasmic heavy metal sensor [Terriglobales bacterium]
MKAFSLMATMLLFGAMSVAQQPMKTPGPGGPPPPGMGQGQPRMRTVPDTRMVPDGEMRMRRGGMPGGGKWWKNSDMVQAVGLSDDQVTRMEKIFQDYRLKLIDQHAALQKEELQMEPLIESDSPDEAKIVAQIDRVANARASLEKSNALMMLGIRKVMSAEQWKKLQELTPPPPPTPRAAPPAPGEGEMRMKRRMPGGELDE